MSELKKSPPWDAYVRKLRELFRSDRDVRIEYDEESRVVKLLVNNAIKADALTRILKPEVQVGDVVLTIQVVPANNAEPTFADLIEVAFANNPALSDIQKRVIGEVPVAYFMFDSRIVQYFDDNISDPYGVTSALLQDIADEVIADHLGAFFSTKSVHEW